MRRFIKYKSSSLNFLNKQIKPHKITGKTVIKKERRTPQPKPIKKEAIIKFKMVFFSLFKYL